MKLLKWLQGNKDIVVESGGKHNIKVTCIHTGEAYPIPASHPTINKYIIKDFQKWLADRGVCPKEEFDQHL